MTEQGRLMKYTVGHYRKEGVTHEDFINWLTKEHLPLAIPIFKRHGIKKYTLVSFPILFELTFLSAIVPIIIDMNALFSL